MLTEGLNGAHWGCGKSSANKRRRKRSHCPKQPCILTSGWLLVETEQPLLLNNSVTLQEWRVRPGLMGDTWQFKRWLWKGSSMLKEQETGLDITQPLYWLLPEKVSRIGGQMIKEMAMHVCTLGIKCFHGKTSLCCSNLGHHMCVKVYWVHVGKVGFDYRRVNPHVCASGVLGNWEGGKKSQLQTIFWMKEEEIPFSRRQINLGAY